LLFNINQASYAAAKEVIRAITRLAVFLASEVFDNIPNNYG